MVPARFLHSWEVLEIDIQYLHQVSAAGNLYLLVMVDNVSMFLFEYSLASKGSLEVSRKLVELTLTFDVPQSIRSDGGGKFTAQVVSHLSRWLNVALNHGPADFARRQGAAERVEGDSRRSCRYRARNGRCDGINMCSTLTGSSG